MSDAPRADPAWDSFWRYDRLCSFHVAPGAPNYGPPIADGWRAFFASLPPRSSVLDIATGNGAIAVLAIEAGDDLVVTGADLADVRPADFVTTASAALGRVTFLANTPGEALPLGDSSVDAIVSQYGIEYSDLDRSLPEAVRVLAPGGRLRFAMHAAEGAIARDTATSIADADFLLDLNLVTLVTNSAPALSLFNAGLKAIADRVPGATDKAMLANVHQSLCDAYDFRRSELVAVATAQRAEILAHRDRQAALLTAARSATQMDRIGDQFRALGLGAIARDEQCDGTDLIGHVIEAKKP